MISLTGVSPTRLYSAAVEKLTPHRLTILFGLVVLGAIAAVKVYRRLCPPLYRLGNQALENGEYAKAVEYFNKELDATKAPHILPYYGRNKADLKLGEFYRVIGSSEKACRCGKPNDLLKAKFYLQNGQAYLGLTEPAKAKVEFENALKLLPSQSKLLAFAHYFQAVVHKKIGEYDNSLGYCIKALEHISKRDLVLKAKVLALQALAFLEQKDYIQAFLVANEARSLEDVGTVSKETRVVIYFILTSSYFSQKEFSQGIDCFTEVLKNIDENDHFLRNILTFKAHLLQLGDPGILIVTSVNAAYEALKKASQTVVDDPTRNELLCCMIRPLMKEMQNGDVLIRTLASNQRLLRK